MTRTLEMAGIMPILSLKSHNNALVANKLKTNKTAYCPNCLKILTFDLNDQILLTRKLNQKQPHRQLHSQTDSCMYRLSNHN